MAVDEIFDICPRGRADFFDHFTVLSDDDSLVILPVGDDCGADIADLPASSLPVFE